MVSKAVLAIVSLVWLIRALPGEAAAKNLPVMFSAPSGVSQIESCIPGYGQIWADRGKLPLGPIYTVVDGRLFSIQYTVAQSDLSTDKSFLDLKAIYSKREVPVQHVDIGFEDAHPGITFPHYHVALYLATHKEHTEIRCP